MSNLRQSVKTFYVTIVMLCLSMTAFAETVEIDGIYYNLEYSWSRSYHDNYGTYLGSSQYYQYAAIVTYDPGVDYWSQGSYSGDIKIPEKVTYNDTEYMVVAVGCYAFSACNSVTSIELPASVVYIDSYAFNQCRSLVSLSMPGVEALGDNVFEYCALSTLSLPKSLKCIVDGNTFRNAMLSSITVDADNENFVSEDGILYNKQKTAIVAFPNKRGGVYRIPNTITTIKYASFPSNLELDELIIPATVTKIDAGAFGDNNNIRKLTIEDGTEDLTIGQGSYSFDGFTDDFGNWQNYFTIFNNITELYWGRSIIFSNRTSLAFAGAYSLQKVVLGPHVTSIPKNSFRSCYSINEVDVKGGIGQWCNFDFTEEGTNPFAYGGGMMGADGIGPKVLFNGEELKDAVIVPNTVTKIPTHGFQYGCSGITDLTLPAEITEIADGAFKSLSKLKTIQLTADCDSFKVVDNVLYNKDISKIICFPQLRVGDYKMPLTITEIVDYQFYNCINLTAVTISGNVKTIPQSAFVGCSKLQTVNIPAAVDSIASSTFNGCGALTQVNFEADSKLKTISDNVFSNCNSLSNITIPASVEYIGWGAFNGCGALTQVNFEADSKLKTLGGNVFANCQNLPEIAIPSSVMTIGDNAFENCTTLKKITYDAVSQLNAISSNTFYNCTSLDSISIPASVKSIGWRAFGNCSSIKQLVFEDGSEDLSLANSSYRYIDSWSGSEWDNETGAFGAVNLDSLYLGRNLTLTYGTNYRTFGSINKVGIGNQVKKVPARLFMDCYSIESVRFNGTIQEWCEISFEDEYATPFGLSGGEGKGVAILYLKESPLHSQVNIPEGATKIGAYSFYGQLGVSTIIVPSTVKTIEKYAFNAPYISDVTINATTVPALTDAQAFNTNTMIFVKDAVVSNYRNKWDALAERICPQGFKLVSVDLEAMSSSPALLPALNALERVNGDYRITALTNLKIRGTMNGWDFLMLRNKMPNLRYLDLEEATILDNDGGMEYYQGYHTTKNAIGPYTFYQIKNLKTVVLPANLQAIGDYAFAESGIESVTMLGDSLTSIGYSAFQSSQLKSVVIPGTIKRIPNNAFAYCYRLTDLGLNNGLEYIEWDAFRECGNLRKLVLPTSLRRIEGNAFSGCYNLQEIDFSEGLAEIGYGAFENCYRLKDLHMPTSLRRIENSAFHYCSGLKEVHVPSMITEIGDYAFKDCGLRSVYAYTVVPVQINQNTFDYTGVDLYAPSNSFYQYYLNTQWSQFLDVKEFDALYTSWYTPRGYDYTVDVRKPIMNLYDNNPADGSMEPGSGLIFIGDGEQVVKNLIMNWQHGDNYPSLIANGNLDVEELKFILNVYPGRWYFFSFPFDVKLSDVKHDGKWVWRYYDAETRAANGSGGWKNVEGDVLKANQGYIFQSNTAGDLELPVDNPDFTAEQTEKEVALQSIESKNAQNASWNFVGNPNLSYYGIDDLANSFDAPITVWDAEQQTYTAVVPGDDDYDFHPFEAYFVQTPENVDNITFEDENRATYAQTEQKAASRALRRAAKRIDEKRMLVNLILSNGENTDKTRVIFNDDNKLTYEAGRDANKFLSMARVPQIYTLDAQNVKYSVNARPNNSREVRIGFVASEEGEYTIDAGRMDCRMALKDHLTGTIHQLDNGSYTFFSEAGTFDSRFSLVPGTDVTAINAKKIDGIDIAPIDDGIVVTGANEGSVNIYKVNGVKAGSIQGTGTVRLDAGTYIVTYAGKSAKVMVK